MGRSVDRTPAQTQAAPRMNRRAGTTAMARRRTSARRAATAQRRIGASTWGRTAPRGAAAKWELVREVPQAEPAAVPAARATAEHTIVVGSHALHARGSLRFRG